MISKIRLCQIVGARCKLYRWLGGLTQEEVAIRGNASQSIVSNIENRYNSITIATLYKVCRGLGITMSEMLAGIEDLDM